MSTLWLVPLLLPYLLDLLPDLSLSVTDLCARLQVLADGYLAGETEVVASHLRDAVLLQVLCGGVSDCGDCECGEWWW